jgi:hypothetical protein
VEEEEKEEKEEEEEEEEEKEEKEEEEEEEEEEELEEEEIQRRRASAILNDRLAWHMCVSSIRSVALWATNSTNGPSFGFDPPAPLAASHLDVGAQVETGRFR